MTPNLSLDDFKKWIRLQETRKELSSYHPWIGTLVETKISLSQLYDRAEVQQGNFKEVVKDFYKNGGIISEVINTDLSIKVDKGTLLISKQHVKI